MDLPYAEVIIDISHSEVDRIFHYKIPEKLLSHIQLGIGVLVPFGAGNKRINGYITGFSHEVCIPEHKIKEIWDINHPVPLFDIPMLQLAHWMKEQYHCTLIDCLHCIIPSGIKTTCKKLQIASVHPDVEHIDDLCREYKNSKKLLSQGKILELLLENGPMPIKELKSVLQISSSSFQTLQKKNLIIVHEMEISREPLSHKRIASTTPFIPTEEQEKVLSHVEKLLHIGQGETVLLHGVTGSGKTEVYLQLIQMVLDRGNQAIVLVPEISLTPQMVNRFLGRFGNRVAITHSRLSQGERYDQWQKAKSGYVDIMIGPRSAVFAPFSSLGLIILDEEHEITYKSEITPKYHAKEIAQKRASLTGCTVLIASATPCIESYFDAQQQKIHLATIKKRTSIHALPSVQIIDMREELTQGNRTIFSLQLQHEIKANLEIGEQTILFLNRRGHSTFVSCRKCGYVMKCKNCSITYTYHASSQSLKCHYCGSKTPNPKICPACGSSYIKYFGTGTQKVEEELSKLFPHGRILRMDNDTTTGKHSHEILLDQFSNRQADILIGTQMIAKGHDFPGVTLVGVLAADLSLHLEDFRSAERTFQLITQVAGRAGRGALAGRVLLQTYDPMHYSIQFASRQDYVGFYKQEIKIREQLDYPPYTNLFSILLIGEDERKVITGAYQLHEIMRYYNKKQQCILLGPVPSVISKVKNQYRFRIIVKCKDILLLKKYGYYCIEKWKNIYKSSDISVQTDINPMMIM